MPLKHLEKEYRNIGYLFVILILLLCLGFYRPYWSLFPHFAGINAIKHFHGIVLFMWFILLTVQPFLIQSGKQKAHKLLGRFSASLVPLIFISIFLVSKDKFNRMAPRISREENIGELALNVSGMFYFIALFALAIYYRKNAAYHIRFIIAAALLLFGPGIGRILENYGGLSFSQSVIASVFISEIITVLLLLYDLKNGTSPKPYLISLFFLFFFQILWMFRFSLVWQTLGGQFADLFF
ncbi:MAG: hypothetical protein PSX36_02840 [bacterium]|nr:hypothetical protein [bacterium]